MAGQERLVEPWLRGALEGVHPLVMPLFFSFAQVREDLAKHVAHLSHQDLWRDVGGASVGFHLKHLAGSVDRLTSYLMGDQLTSEQLDVLAQEHQPNGGPADILELVNNALRRSEERIRAIDPATIFEKRTVGRRELPTTVIGLLVHIAEHTQRHLGQAITLAKNV